MSAGSVEEALIAYKKVHRALLTSTASRWRHLDISMPQLRAIYLLRDEEVATVGRLAELFGIAMPAASILADRLVRAGYVERNGDTADRRRGLLTLTRAGIQLVTELRRGPHPYLPLGGPQFAHGYRPAHAVLAGACCRAHSPRPTPGDRRPVRPRPA